MTFKPGHKSGQPRHYKGQRRSRFTVALWDRWIERSKDTTGSVERRAGIEEMRRLCAITEDRLSGKHK